MELFDMINEIYYICYILLFLEMGFIAYLILTRRSKEQIILFCSNGHNLAVGDFVILEEKKVYVVESTPNSVTLAYKDPVIKSETVEDKIKRYNLLKSGIRS